MEKMKDPQKHIDTLADMYTYLYEFQKGGSLSITRKQFVDSLRYYQAMLDANTLNISNVATGTEIEIKEIINFFHKELSQGEVSDVYRETVEAFRNILTIAKNRENESLTTGEHVNNELESPESEQLIIPVEETETYESLDDTEEKIMPEFEEEKNMETQEKKNVWIMEQVKKLINVCSKFCGKSKEHILLVIKYVIAGIKKIWSRFCTILKKGSVLIITPLVFMGELMLTIFKVFGNISFRPNLSFLNMGFSRGRKQDYLHTRHNWSLIGNTFKKFAEQLLGISLEREERLGIFSENMPDFCGNGLGTIDVKNQEVCEIEKDVIPDFKIYSLSKGFTRQTVQSPEKPKVGTATLPFFSEHVKNNTYCFPFSPLNQTLKEWMFFDANKKPLYDLVHTVKLVDFSRIEITFKGNVKKKLKNIKEIQYTTNIYSNDNYFENYSPYRQIFDSMDVEAVFGKINAKRMGEPLFSLSTIEAHCEEHLQQLIAVYENSTYSTDPHVSKVHKAMGVGFLELMEMFKTGDCKALSSSFLHLAAAHNMPGCMWYGFSVENGKMVVQPGHTVAMVFLRVKNDFGQQVWKPRVVDITLYATSKIEDIHITENDDKRRYKETLYGIEYAQNNYFSKEHKEGAHNALALSFLQIKSLFEKYCNSDSSQKTWYSSRDGFDFDKFRNFFLFRKKEIPKNVKEFENWVSYNTKSSSEIIRVGQSLIVNEFRKYLHKENVNWETFYAFYEDIMKTSTFERERKKFRLIVGKKLLVEIKKRFQKTGQDVTSENVRDIMSFSHYTKIFANGTYSVYPEFHASFYEYKFEEVLEEFKNGKVDDVNYGSGALFRSILYELPKIFKALKKRKKSKEATTIHTSLRFFSEKLTDIVIQSQKTKLYSVEDIQHCVEALVKNVPDVFSLKITEEFTLIELLKNCFYADFYTHSNPESMSVFFEKSIQNSFYKFKFGSFFNRMKNRSLVDYNSIKLQAGKYVLADCICSETQDIKNLRSMDTYGSMGGFSTFINSKHKFYEDVLNIVIQKHNGVFPYLKVYETSSNDDDYLLSKFYSLHISKKNKNINKKIEYILKILIYNKSSFLSSCKKILTDEQECQIVKELCQVEGVQFGNNLLRYESLLYFCESSRKEFVPLLKAQNITENIISSDKRRHKFAELIAQRFKTDPLYNEKDFRLLNLCLDNKHFTKRILELYQSKNLMWMYPLSKQQRMQIVMHMQHIFAFMLKNDSPVSKKEMKAFVEDYVTHCGAVIFPEVKIMLQLLAVWKRHSYENVSYDVKQKYLRLIQYLSVDHETLGDTDVNAERVKILTKIFTQYVEERFSDQSKPQFRNEEFLTDIFTHFVQNFENNNDLTQLTENIVNTYKESRKKHLQTYQKHARLSGFATDQKRATGHEYTIICNEYLQYFRKAGRHEKFDSNIAARTGELWIPVYKEYKSKPYVVSLVLDNILDTFENGQSIEENITEFCIKVLPYIELVQKKVEGKTLFCGIDIWCRGEIVHSLSGTDLLFFDKIVEYLTKSIYAAVEFDRVFVKDPAYDIHNSLLPQKTALQKYAYSKVGLHIVKPGNNRDLYAQEQPQLSYMKKNNIPTKIIEVDF